MIRVSDTIGAGTDGRLYLILTQMKDENFQVVGERLQQKNVAYELVDKNADLTFLTEPKLGEN